jgi:hypothetical protein
MILFEKFYTPNVTGVEGTIEYKKEAKAKK